MAITYRENFYWRSSFCCLLLAVSGSLTGCGGGGGGDPAPIIVMAPPTITSQPSSQAISVGQTASFAVSATGDAPLDYQWQRGGADVPGATSTTFTLGSVQLNDNGSVWTARISNAAATVVSVSATLSVQTEPVTPVVPVAPAMGTITLVAGSIGSGSAGSTDGIGDAARFNLPSGLAIDALGNLYTADVANYTIRKVSSNGTVTTLAGLSGTRGVIDGSGTAARFDFLKGVAIGSDGLLRVIQSEFNSLTPSPDVLRTVTPLGQVSTTFLTGRTSPSFNMTGSGIAVDKDNNIYLLDNQALRKYSPAGALLDSFVVNSSGGNSENDGLASDQSGNIYFSLGNSIRKRTPNGLTTTLAGPASETSLAGSTDGLGTQARFLFYGSGRSNGRSNFAVDSSGNVYAIDTGNHTVRKIAPDGLVTTIAGKAGEAGIQTGNLPGRLLFPSGLALQGDKTLYVASGNAILKIALP